MNCQQTSFLDRGDGVRLAYALSPGSGPTIVFLPGYKSDMQGNKALALEAEAHARGQAMLRLDYSGHGASGGRFEDGSISRWRDDVLCLIDALLPGPLLLVGSSMGGWLALLVALARPAQLAAIQLIAPAPDFTRWGVADMPMTEAFQRDGNANSLMLAPIIIHCPIRILHGQQDQDVPYKHSLHLIDQLTSSDVHLTLIKDGDHRLSRLQDIEQLVRSVQWLHALKSGSS
jgi:pimeloyl-ACP methyl ester carboxylesterase